jgi:hypothetical protein
VFHIHRVCDDVYAVVVRLATDKIAAVRADGANNFGALLQRLEQFLETHSDAYAAASKVAAAKKALKATKAAKAKGSGGGGGVMAIAEGDEDEDEDGDDDSSDSDDDDADSDDEDSGSDYDDGSDLAASVAVEAFSMRSYEAAQACMHRCVTFLSSLAKSHTYTDRQLFVRVCRGLVRRISPPFFRKFFGPLLHAAGSDATSNVRLLVAQALEDVGAADGAFPYASHPGTQALAVGGATALVTFICVLFCVAP